jgi:hypothetical protein
MDVSDYLVVDAKIWGCHGGVHKHYRSMGCDVEQSGRNLRLYPEDRGTGSPETSVYLYKTTRRQIAEDKLLDANVWESLRNPYQPAIHDHIPNLLVYDS